MNLGKHCLRALLALCGIVNSQFFAMGTVYVSEFGANAVAVINPNTNIVTAINLPGTNPRDLAVSPNRLEVYVPEFGSNDVAVIDAITNAVVATIPVGVGPESVAFTPNGNFAYVANFGTFGVSTTSVIDTNTRTVVATIPTSPFAQDVAVTPDGRFAYVAAANKVYVIDTSTNTVATTISTLGVTNTAISITPDGTKAYTSTNQMEVQVIDIATNTVVDTIPQTPTESLDNAITSDGKLVYVPFFGNTTPNVSVIDVATNTNVASFTVGTPAQGVALQPDLTFGYIAIQAANQVTVFAIGTNNIVANINLPNFSEPEYIAIATINAPASLTAKAKKDDFAMVYEIYNVLRWTASTSIGTIGFNIYRNGVKIATVGPNTFKYKDHNRQKGATYVYEVTAFDSLGNEGAAATFTITD